MESAGARLKKLRLERGITIEEVHKRTKIHLDILKSIEDDSFININPVYLKGFLKIYCNFLGVNASDYLPEEGRPVIGTRPLPEPEKPSRFLEPIMPAKPFLNNKIIFIFIFTLVFLFLPIVLFITRHQGNKRQMLAKKNIAVSQSLNKKANTVAGRKPLPAKKTFVVKSPVKKLIKPVKKQSSDGLITKLSPIAAHEQGDSEIRLGIRSLDDCWLQAKVDNRIIFQNVLKKGRIETWTAKDKIELTLGSAGAVQLEINGRLVPPLGRKGQVLKNIVITQKEGLKIGK